ncbi:integrase, catalytic region, zinc finger, CCHC-type containing protein [Tanacetum coccineum]
MNIYNMKLEQFQVNAKFLNTLPPEWSKFVTDVKLVQDLHTTNVDQLHAYLGQHEFNANELLSLPPTPTTIHQSEEFVNTRKYLRASGSNYGKQRTVICYNCKGEGHMSKQCTKPKRKRDDSWFKDNVLLVQAQARGQILHEGRFSKSFSIEKGSAVGTKSFMKSLNSVNSPEPTLSSRPTKVEVPKELPKVSMVNTSLKKLKYHLAGFDVVCPKKEHPQPSLRARGADSSYTFSTSSSSSFKAEKELDMERLSFLDELLVVFNIGSELGSELTILASSELMVLRGLKLACYRNSAHSISFLRAVNSLPASYKAAKDIQYAGSDTRPPMLDRTDFASWQQCIVLYYRWYEGALHLGLERPRVYFDLSPEDKESVKMLLEGLELTKEDQESQLYDDFEHFHQNKGETIHDYYVRLDKLINDMRNIKMTMSRMQLNLKFVNNMLPEWDDLVVVQNVQGRQNRGHGNNARGSGSAGYGGAQNRVGNANPGQARQERIGDMDLALNVDNVFQADDSDAFDSNVDEAPMAQTMFMANLSFAYHVYDEAGPSYDSNILSEVHDHDHYQDAVCEHHEEHEMHDGCYVINGKRTRKIDEQLRIVINDRNIKEENLKKELHSVKMQLASTINHNKSIVEEVTSLRKDFKQKENKYLEKILDMKALKEKVEDKLYKQDQSLQTVHMLCKPKPYYNEQNKVAFGYKNPLCLTRAKQVQPALYNGYEIIKNNHVLFRAHPRIP